MTRSLTSQITRRSVLALGGSALALAALPLSAQTSVSLGAAGAAAGLMVGSAMCQEVFADPPYGALVAQESRITTLMNAMKFDWLRPRGPDADFTLADRLVQFANDNAITLRGSAPIWNDWPAAWLKGLSGAELRRLFDAHIDEVIGRYAGRIPYWDLVNEPFEPIWYKSEGWRQGPWFEAYGKAYVDRALRRAAAIDPAARLFINEAAMENDDDIGRSLRPHALTEIDRLLDDGVPLHGIGIQSHLMPAKPHDYEQFAQFLGELGRRGLEIHLTELDLFDNPYQDDFTLRDEAVAAGYRRYLDAVLAVPQVKAITVWGLSEPYGFPWWTWQNVRGGVGREPRGLLYDAARQPRPSRDAVIASLNARMK
jgi:endo-1,4-beta-xylanase